MFVLISVEDTVVVAAKYLGNPLDTIKNEIRIKYVNKYLKDTGLCVTLFDIISVGEAFVAVGDGSSHVRVQFRLVVFRPFVGEVIEGVVKSSDTTGIQVSLGFFDDIFVPPHFLRDPSKFLESEKLWYWQFGEHKLFVELNKKVRFRVDSVVFNEKPSKRPPTSHSSNTEDTDSNNVSPMLVIGSMNESGLGCIQWWS